MYICRELIQFLKVFGTSSQVADIKLDNISNDVFPFFAELCEVSFKFCKDQKLVLSQTEL